MKIFKGFGRSMKIDLRINLIRNNKIHEHFSFFNKNKPTLIRLSSSQFTTFPKKTANSHYRVPKKLRVLKKFHSNEVIQV